MNPENQQRGYSKDPIPLADYGILVGALNAALALTAAGHFLHQAYAKSKDWNHQT